MLQLWRMELKMTIFRDPFTSPLEIILKIFTFKLRHNYDRLISSELTSELAYEQFSSTFGHGHF